MIFNLSNPSRFQKISDIMYPWVSSGSAIFFIIGIVFAFFLSPPDYLQGEIKRMGKINNIHITNNFTKIIE